MDSWRGGEKGREEREEGRREGRKERREGRKERREGRKVRRGRKWGEGSTVDRGERKI